MCHVSPKFRPFCHFEPILARSDYGKYILFFSTPRARADNSSSDNNKESVTSLDMLPFTSSGRSCDDYNEANHSIKRNAESRTEPSSFTVDGKCKIDGNKTNFVDVRNEQAKTKYLLSIFNEKRLGDNDKTNHFVDARNRETRIETSNSVEIGIQESGTEFSSITINKKINDVGAKINQELRTEISSIAIKENRLCNPADIRNQELSTASSSFTITENYFGNRYRNPSDVDKKIAESKIKTEFEIKVSGTSTPIRESRKLFYENANPVKPQILFQIAEVNKELSKDKVDTQKLGTSFNFNLNAMAISSHSCSKKPNKLTFSVPKTQNISSSSDHNVSASLPNCSNIKSILLTPTLPEISRCNSIVPLNIPTTLHQDCSCKINTNTTTCIVTAAVRSPTKKPTGSSFEKQSSAYAHTIEAQTSTLKNTKLKMSLLQALETELKGTNRKFSCMEKESTNPFNSEATLPNVTKSLQNTCIVQPFNYQSPVKTVAIPSGPCATTQVTSACRR